MSIAVTVYQDIPCHCNREVMRWLVARVEIGGDSRGVWCELEKGEKCVKVCS